MSYASAVASNIPVPPSEQPHPDQALLNTDEPTAPRVVDDTSKVSVVPNDYKTNPKTQTGEAQVPYADYDDGFPSSDKKKKTKGSKRLQEAGAEGLYIWEVAKHYLLRPGVAGGLLGLLNIGLLFGGARAFYLDPQLRRDRRVISASAAAAVALLSAEGFAAEKYAQTPRGQAEARRAKEEGTLLYKHLHQQILRPGVLGGLVGLANAGVLGAVGYFSYVHWDKPQWDKRTVSAVVVGLLTLWSGEGYLAEQKLKK